VVIFKQPADDLNERLGANEEDYKNAIDDFKFERFLIKIGVKVRSSHNSSTPSLTPKAAVGMQN